MIKDIIAANETVKPNRNEMEILHAHFPQCFNADGEFDIDKFQELIKDSVGIAHEGYDLNFLGKSYAKLLASIDTTTVIIPDEEHNSKPENINSKNIYISGDNLDGLKHLLKSYSGKVKCIYIDPPYNTGSDGFVYNDNFNFTSEELQTKLSVSEEHAKKILDITKRGSASHSAWLMFMASRLQLAKDLLTEDGVIFISIDDNEQANLKLLCDSIFGEENLIGCFKWNRVKKAPSLSDTIRIKYEYVLLYGVKTIPNLFGKESYNEQGPLWHLPNAQQELVFPAQSIRIKESYRAGDYGGTYKVVLLDDMVAENGLNRDAVRIKACSAWGQDKINEYCAAGNTFEIKRSPCTVYTDLTKDGNFIPPSDIISDSECEVKTNTDANEYLKEYGIPFSYSKPVSLIKYLLNMVLHNVDDAIIVDFFSGSATSADAIMQLNTIGKHYKYILVQLPEDLDTQYERASSIDKPSIKATIDFLDNLNLPHTIDHIGQERIRRVATKIKTDTNIEIDYGFKHYTLVEPTDKTLSKLDSFDASAMFDDNTILSEFGTASVLETWKVRDGYGFGAESEVITLDQYTAHYIDKHLYLVDSGFTENDMVALIDKYNSDGGFNPEQIVIFGYSFTFSTIEMLKSNLTTLREGAKNLKVNIDIRY